MATDINEADKDRLGKIVQLAKNGHGGEKQNAISILKKLCLKYHLEFDDVMSDREEVNEYTIKYRDKQEEAMIVQVVLRYALMSIDDQIHYNQYRKVVIFKTTYERYIETMHAVEVFTRLFRKEKKKIAEALIHGFVMKHDLYYKPTQEERDRDAKLGNTKERDLNVERMAMGLAGAMEDAQLHKRLKS